MGKLKNFFDYILIIFFPLPRWEGQGEGDVLFTPTLPPPSRGRNSYCIFFTFIFLLFASFAHAETLSVLGISSKPKEIKSFKIFKHIPILENGRVKPLDTFARNFLTRLSGKQTVNREKAIAWFARFLFAPDTTKNDKIFLVNNPELATGLGIKEDKHRRYSFAEMEPAFEKLAQLYQQAQAIEPKERDLVENEIIRLYENLKLYSQLSLSFSFTFPHPDFTIKEVQNRKDLGLTGSSVQNSYIDIALRAETIHKLTSDLDHIKEDQWTSAQKELINTIANLFTWTVTYQNLPFNIVPAYETEDQNWYSPWDALARGIQTKEGREELVALRNMEVNYWNGNQIEFDLAVKNFNTSINHRLTAKEHPAKNIDLEVMYNNLQPFLWAKILYLFSFILFLCSFMFPSEKFRGFVLRLIIAGFALHTFGVIMRMIILARPPVSTLYETFIFVGFISALAGLIIEKFNKQWLGIVTASLSGYVFLTIASKFANDGDTMQMLVAVLNSNFWLSTHVTSITIGYAGTCVAGVIGHVYLLQRIFKPNDKELLRSTYSALLGALGFGLTMTFLGTNLGGIWADQSWGRFWGWDPKENGALLIVIWTALLFHLKIAKMINEIGMAVGSVIGIIVVMWAWFGVNLLSIGLHSYGFTSGLATNLSIYFVLQVLFLIIVYPLAKKKA